MKPADHRYAKKLYYLTHPRNDRVRYVGCTGHPLKERLASHVREARKWPVGRPIREWIAGLRKQGLYPRVRLLHVFEGAETVDFARSQEFYLIRYHRMKQADLLNQYNYPPRELAPVIPELKWTIEDIEKRKALAAKRRNNAK